MCGSVKHAAVGVKKRCVERYWQMRWLCKKCMAVDIKEVWVSDKENIIVGVTAI